MQMFCLVQLQIPTSLPVMLTPWKLGYDLFVLWNWPKTSSCRLPYRCHSSSADYARELFKL